MDRALWRVCVLVGRTCDRVPSVEQMNFSVRVLKPEAAPRQDRNRVPVVVNTREVGDLSEVRLWCACGCERYAYLFVKHVGVGCITNSWGTIGNGLDVDIRGKVKRHVECLELCEGTAQRMADLGRVMSALLSEGLVFKDLP